MPEKAKKLCMSFPTKDEFTIPEGFDGVFRFTNPSDEDYYGTWNKVQYYFPKKKTVPLIVPNETLESVQHIMKKFALELSTREFHKAEKFKNMERLTPPGSGLVPAPYSDMELKEYADQCLIPLESERPKMAKIAPESTTIYHTDVTQVLDDKDADNRKELAEGRALAM